MKLYERFIKVIVYCIAACLLLTLLNSIKITLKKHVPVRKPNNVKHILLWTSNNTVPFNSMGEGRKVFIDRRCRYTNCYVTADRSYLKHYTMFDVIAFSGPDIEQYGVILPESRSPHQKFVFASIESAAYYSLCNHHLSGYFNWTWTYRLESEVRWGYIVIRDNNSNIIGPSQEMKWLKVKDMNPIDEEMKEVIKRKVRPIAWFVSNCLTLSKREEFVTELSKELYTKYNIQIDVYGRCGKHKCPRDEEDVCYRKIEKYYFYFAFENAFSEDYVTEKLLIPLQNKAVPIVFGGADYKRFMPDGIYLDARKLGAQKLAEKINELINDHEKYGEYFKWRNHYSYHRTTDSPETDEYCKMCELLNNKKKVNEIRSYYNFKYWWTQLNICDD